MKICILTHSLNPHTGAGKFSVNLIDNIRKTEPKIYFSIMTSEDYLTPKLWKLVSNLNQIRKKIRESDVIHALDAYPYGVIAVLANIGINKPVIITAIGSGSIQLLRKMGFKTFLLKYAYRKASTVTAISAYTASKIKEHVLGLRIEIINHGVNTTYFAQSTDSSFNSKLDELRPYILSVGEMKRRKGYDKMLYVIKEIINSGINCNYIIVSNNQKNLEYWYEINSLIDELGIRKYVKVFSKIDDDKLKSIYQNAHSFFLLPQDINGDVEGFGLSILEAAAAGVPSVIQKGSGADDAVKNKISGFLVESALDAGDQLQKIFNSKILQKKLSAGARQFAIGMDWLEQVEKYIVIYKKSLK